MEFLKWPKIPRLNRNMTITEKLDGTNAQVYIKHVRPSDEMREDFVKKGWNTHYVGMYEYVVIPGSRNKFITVKEDHFGFAKWVQGRSSSLLQLGPGRHYGEWWGKGVQRGYGMLDRHFSLFNTSMYTRDGANNTIWAPLCCGIVPVLYRGPFNMGDVEYESFRLKVEGSVAAPGFMNPEGIVVFHEAANQTFKVTLNNDECRKGEK